MKSIFIIGASGFIGSYLFKRFQAGGWKVKGSYFQHPEEELIQINITDKAELLAAMKKDSPEVVCLPAANPNVEYCEVHPSETDKINVEGTRNVSLVCKEIGAKLVYFSSDYIFDGKSGPYSEDDIPNPISIYGKQKLTSEMIIKDILDDYLIARTTIVYGWEKRGKNFVEWLLKALAERKEIKVPRDQIGSPTYVENLTEMIFSLVEKDARGIFNVCGSELMDRYRFARRVAEIFGLDPSHIKPVTTEELKQKAPRPLRLGMKIDKIEGTIPVKPQGVDSGLKRMREQKVYSNG